MLQRIIIAAAVLFNALSPATAQDYPTKPVHFIVPFAPGGNTDIQARLIGQKLTASLGQQVIIDNRPGAGGTIGVEIAAKAPADGYTLVLASFGILAPAGTPKAIVKRLNQEINRAFAAPDIKAAYAAEGIEPSGGTPEECPPNYELLACDADHNRNLT